MLTLHKGVGWSYKVSHRLQGHHNREPHKPTILSQGRASREHRPPLALPQQNYWYKSTRSTCSAGHKPPETVTGQACHTITRSSCQDCPPAPGRASVAEQTNARVTAGREQPRLSGMERDVQHTRVVSHGVTAEHLKGHQQRVGQKVRVHHAMEHVHCSVIGARRKQRVAAVEGRAPQASGVVAQRLVRLVAQVQVVPAHVCARRGRRSKCGCLGVRARVEDKKKHPLESMATAPDHGDACVRGHLAWCVYRGVRSSPFLPPERMPRRLSCSPRQALVIGAHQHVVARGVDGEAGDSAAAAHKLLGQHLRVMGSGERLPCSVAIAPAGARFWPLACYPRMRRQPRCAHPTIRQPCCGRTVPVCRAGEGVHNGTGRRGAHGRAILGTVDTQCPEVGVRDLQGVIDLRPVYLIRLVPTCPHFIPLLLLLSTASCPTPTPTPTPTLPNPTALLNHHTRGAHMASRNCTLSLLHLPCCTTHTCTYTPSHDAHAQIRAHITNAARSPPRPTNTRVHALAARRTCLARL